MEGVGGWSAVLCRGGLQTIGKFETHSPSSSILPVFKFAHVFQNRTAYNHRAPRCLGDRGACPFRGTQSVCVPFCGQRTLSPPPDNPDA